VAATSITGAGSACLGTTSTLSVQGGSLAGSSDWEWYAGSCGGTVVGTGSSIAVTPTGTTTYNVAATGNGACPATACASGTVTLPTPSNSLSGDGVTATCTVNQNGYIHLLASNGDLVASINSNGQNLGTVTATSYIEGSPLLVEACNSPGNTTAMTSVMDRHWVITTQFPPSAPVNVLLPFTEGEFSSLNFEAFNNANPNDDVLNYTQVGSTKYSGPNEDDLFPNNCVSNGGSGNLTWHSQTSNGQVNTYLASHPGTNRFITINVNSFSEFWLHGSSNSVPLPVELISFQANCTDDNKVDVTWSTASENNSSHFILRRSYDGINWENIGFIQAAGMSQNTINYSIQDVREGNNRDIYYQLDQYDIDGLSKEVREISVDCETKEVNSMQVYPNPGNDIIYVELNSNSIKGQTTLVMSDMNGAVIFQMEFEAAIGENNLMIKPEYLEPGVYFIHYINDGIKSNATKYVRL
jgi:hypothetical protein